MLHTLFHILFHTLLRYVVEIMLTFQRACLILTFNIFVKVLCSTPSYNYVAYQLHTLSSTFPSTYPFTGEFYDNDDNDNTDNIVLGALSQTILKLELWIY